jgi:conjugative transfer signal peptidase TraF
MTVGRLVRLKSTDTRRAKRIAAVALATLVLVVMIPAFAGLRINDSPSLPIGLYVVTSDSNAALVEFCPTEPYSSLAAERGYRSRGSCRDGGAPLMKPIVARAGDTLDVSSSGIVVNGRMLPNSVSLADDTSGRTLSHWPFGMYRVKPGTVWVISSYSRRSFDSRYFGPIAETQIRHHLRPLLTR